MRYNIWYDIPLSKKGIVPKSLSFVVNDEVHINFGKEIVYNYFDQNRFFVGLKYQFTDHSNLQVGYMNLFQQLSAGNKYRTSMRSVFSIFRIWILERLLSRWPKFEWCSMPGMEMK